MKFIVEKIQSVIVKAKTEEDAVLIGLELISEGDCDNEITVDKL